MMQEFEKYNPEKIYSGADHAPSNHPGHGNKVQHVADNEIGIVLVSNSKRSLVRFEGDCAWYPNADLKIHVRHEVGS